MKKVFIILLSLFQITLLASNINILTMDSNPKRVDATKKGIILSYNNAIKEIKKSVVNISSTKKIKTDPRINQMFNNPFFRDFFGQQLPKIPQKRKMYSLGSGVIISADGYIVTNNHVVDGADEIMVTISNSKKEYKAKIIGQDPKTDLAVIKIDAKNLPVARFGDSSNLLEGDIVFAIGNPFGVGESVTQGIISALNKSRIGLNQYENFIQTDASINPGNSGGALVDTRGALIGINSAILSRSGGNNGIGFAIPSNMVKKIATSLINNGKIERGFLGVSISDLKPDMKDLYNSDYGALVLSVEKESPAEKSGFKRGDLIVSVDNEKVEDANSLKNIIGSKKPGNKVSITYERDKKLKTANVKLAKLGDKGGFGSDIKEYGIEGLSVSNLTSQIRAQYNIPSSLEGVIVLDVKPDSKADSYGFKRGDIIIQVQNKTIKSMEDLNKALGENKNKTKIVYLNRGGYVTYLVIK